MIVVSFARQSMNDKLCRAGTREAVSLYSSGNAPPPMLPGCLGAGKYFPAFLYYVSSTVITGVCGTYPLKKVKKNWRGFDMHTNLPVAVLRFVPCTPKRAYCAVLPMPVCGWVSGFGGVA